MQAAPTAPEALFGEWRAEVAERCESLGITLSWTLSGDTTVQALDGGTALALSRVMREVITNSLKHCSGLEHLSVTLTVDGDQLHMAVSHPYNGAPPDQWRAGLGLNNLRKRIESLSGEIDWVPHDGQLTTRWQLHLAPVQPDHTPA